MYANQAKHACEPPSEALSLLISYMHKIKNNYEAFLTTNYLHTRICNSVQSIEISNINYQHISDKKLALLVVLKRVQRQQNERLEIKPIRVAHLEE